MKRLFEIQQALKAPKDKNNSFGGFNYRNASDIIEAVKPLLEKRNLVLILTDNLNENAGASFIEAIASLYDTNDGHKVMSATSFAEISDHKGMTRDQATGAASSYARKYALCGLFSIDDSKQDPDSLSRPDDIRKFLKENRAWVDWLKEHKFTCNEKWDDEDILLAGSMIKLNIAAQENVKRTTKE